MAQGQDHIQMFRSGNFKNRMTHLQGRKGDAMSSGSKSKATCWLTPNTYGALGSWNTVFLAELAEGSQFLSRDPVPDPGLSCLHPSARIYEFILWIQWLWIWIWLQIMNMETQSTTYHLLMFSTISILLLLPSCPASRNLSLEIIIIIIIPILHYR